MLKGLANLGSTTIRRLEEIGIRDRESLSRIGPGSAYKRLCVEAGARLPACYYLYALEGALRNINWRAISDEDKTRLRREAGLDG